MKIIFENLIITLWKFIFIYEKFNEHILINHYVFQI